MEVVVVILLLLHARMYAHTHRSKCLAFHCK